MAAAHRVLMIAYYMIRDGTVYHELGGDHYDRRNPEKTARRLTQRLERIGYQVTLKVADRATPDPMNRPVRNGTTRWRPEARRRGRPCKCAERGLICKHHQPSTIQPEKISSPDLSTT
jgi:hypothetical protein